MDGAPSAAAAAADAATMSRCAAAPLDLVAVVWIFVRLVLCDPYVWPCSLANVHERGRA